MLGIWHEGEWLKRDLAQPFYGWLERGSPILGLDFASLMKGYFFLYLYENYDGLYEVYMVVISLVFLSLLRSLFTYFMRAATNISHHVLTCY